MNCAGCGAENREGRRFCRDCGTPLPAACPNCGFENQPEEKYCGGCGHVLALAETHSKTGGAPAPRPAAAEGERRQVTVLFCDLAGYTRLTRELGAEAVHDMTDRFFSLVDGLIERFGGTVDKHIGDCAMAVFGAPVAHGNDPERAMRAALAIQGAMPDLSRELGRDLNVHIGIASGQVVASGGAGHRTYSITGDSVNLASRLADTAAAGVILISDAVRHMLPPGLACQEAGAVEVKGLAEPVRAWRLLGFGEAAAPDRPFVGRRAELVQFRDALGACRVSGTGQAVVVRGEAGIGKTRLVEEFQAQATAEGFACHLSLVLDFGAGTGQDAIRALTRSLLGLRAGSEPAARQAALEQAAAADPALVDRRVFLNDLLDLPQPTEVRGLYDAMDGATRSRGVRETVAALVRQASTRAPLLLAIEDLHWADQATLGHLASLAEAAATCPVILVMTSRIEGDPLDHAWRASIGGSPLVTIDLQPLRAPEANALAAAYFDANSDFARRCIERAAGNPLFLEQLLRHAKGAAETAVPGSVQSLVQARIDQLDPFNKQALQAAAIFGQRFALDALRHALQSPDYSCAALVERFLIRPIGEEFLFAHALIRDAVYDTLLRPRRRELHRRAAEWFASRDLVLHAEHLDRAEAPEAPHAYLEAARAQAADYRYERARALTERGLALAADPAACFVLTCLHGEILHDLGAMAESRAAYERALEAAGDDRARASAWLGLAGVKRVTDDLEGAFADLDRAQAAAEQHGLVEMCARIHFLRGNLHFPRGNITGCLAEHQKSLELALATDLPELEAQAFGGLGDADYARGRMISAHRHLERCVGLAGLHGLGRLQVANRSQMAHAAVYFRPLREVLDEGLAAAAAAAEVGHLRAEINARVANVFVLCTMVDLGRLKAEIGLVVDLVQRLGARRFLQSSLPYVGKAALLEGDRSEAVRILRETLEIGHQTGITFSGPSILGPLALALSDLSERRQMLAQGEAIIRHGCVAHNHLRFYPDAIDVALELGEWDEAERYAAALEEFARAEPLPWSDFFAARGRALAAIGRDGADESAQPELERLAAEARHLDYRIALPAIERALARLGTGSGRRGSTYSGRQAS
jgi:class 3 adenylate cyclase/tetratricopeptide (TPR) repeat protein